jgi:hypothetical protein
MSVLCTQVNMIFVSVLSARHYAIELCVRLFVNPGDKTLGTRLVQETKWRGKRVMFLLLIYNTHFYTLSMRCYFHSKAVLK